MRRSAASRLILCALLWFAGFAHAGGALKEPKTGVEFPADTVFNGQRYRIAHTSNIATRVLGIGTWAAAVGYYIEAGALDPRRDVPAQLPAPESARLLVLAFVRPVPAQSLRELMQPELSARLLPDSADSRRDIGTLMAGIEDMKRGEVIQFVWLRSGELEMLVKRSTRARLVNAPLARAIWDMFLPRPDGRPGARRDTGKGDTGKGG